MKTGVVDVGGGLRGIYAAGVFDWCMDNGIRFDLGIGVSAGSANLASYAAGQRGRNFRFYTEYAFRHQYMGLGNFISKRSLFDPDYVYGTLSCSDGSQLDRVGEIVGQRHIVPRIDPRVFDISGINGKVIIRFS